MSATPRAAVPSAAATNQTDTYGTGCDWTPSDADVTAALLDLVVQASAVLAKAHSTSHEDGTPMLNRVFFSGGFVSANPLARSALARSLRALGCEALFFRHSDFLGAIGALARSWPGGPDAFHKEWEVAE